MATQVHIPNDQACSSRGLSSKQDDNSQQATTVEQRPLDTISLTGRDSTAEAPTPEIIAHGVEFVASPGRGEKLQRAIPEAVRLAFDKSGSFAGCMVLVSEQEARLVTVITLWTGRDRARECDENSKRVKVLLTPFVDSCLRARRFTAFLSTR